VVTRVEEGVRFRASTHRELKAYSDACAAAPGDLLGKISEIRPAANTRGVSAVTAIGIRDFRDIFSPRQRLLLESISRSVSELWRTRKDHFETDQIASAVCSVLSLIVGRLADYCSTLCTWVAGGTFVGHTFTKQALPNVWDFAEVNALSGGSGSIDSALNWVLRVLDANIGSICVPGSVAQADARDAIVPNGSADLAFTDPPYYAEIPYADISDFFYIWLRRCMGEVDPELFAPAQVDRAKELIVTNTSEGIKKDASYFEDGICQAASSLRRSTKESGLLVFVFANAKTSAWESMLQALINAKLRVVASWPIDTERAARTRAQQAASLQSSVHIVCRPRERLSTASVGDWRDVLSELPHRIHEWMPRLHDEGVVGADAIFACLGPALEIFSRYERVEKANGDAVTLNEYLEHVWAAVAKEALATVFKGADATGFEADARLTAMWLWTLKTPDTNGETERTEEEASSEDVPASDSTNTKASGFSLEYDAARKIAQGLGAQLEGLNHLVEISGAQARLLPVSDRTQYLFGKDEGEPARTVAGKKKSTQLDMFAELTEAEDAEAAWKEKTVKRVGDTTLDRVHQGMILFAAGRGEALKRFVVEDGVGRDGKFWRLAQALSALYPSGSDEKRWVDGVLARKKQLGF
jgi:adenine-specific DNA methylase